MPIRLLATLFAVVTTSSVFSQTDIDLAGMQRMDGFYDLYWDESSGGVYMTVEAIDEPFIYQVSLPRGVGSNDIGLDRGQLGSTKVVRFVRSGPQLLLVEDNLGYRAVSDNADERAAIAESFARSVIWGFEDLDPAADRTVIDMTPFFVRDAHGVANVLQQRNEGGYSVDASRSAMYIPRTKSFPDNTEAEALVTLVGQASGPHLPTVVPDTAAVTVHVHHSFIRLPEDGYEPLEYDSRSGVIGLRYDYRGFADYASPVGEKLTVNFGRRHRLEKKDPDAELSEAVEPIVYYLDRGAPEPVRSALLDGARWWNQAFEAAGYKDAFQVEILPEDADPMDVRYNVIQWVHRSTRGWSYGASIIDPRTGEILKGHVTLGSLRVRQDYLIAEGLLAPYADESVPPEMLEMSLARIRQLSAHEVGHTIGFEHNFAASTQDRSSVMDYPFPLIRVRDDNSFDLSEAYDDKIGSWDIRTIIYAYQDFPDGVDPVAERKKILAETIEQGFRYVADADGRSVATAHPHGNVWDNGEDSIAELEHLLRVRKIALDNFSERNIRMGRSLAELEEALVPIYLLHRFQVPAVGKLIGGEYFTYDHRGDGQSGPTRVTEARQREAVEALLDTLDPALLRLPDGLAEMISPRPPNNSRTRETFAGSTGMLFDATAPAASSVALTLDVLLNPARAARTNRHNAPGFDQIAKELVDRTWYARPAGGITGAIQRQTNLQVLHRLLRLAFDQGADADVRGTALLLVAELEEWTKKQPAGGRTWRGHYALLHEEIKRIRHDPALLESLAPVTVPPGSPIGDGY